MTVEEYIKDKDIRNNTTFLNLSNKNITSLKGIEIFENLENLLIQNNSIKSLEELSSLKNLKYINCYNSSLTSLKGIENLTFLEDVIINNTNIKSIEEISELINLQELSAEYCNIQNLNIKTFKNLKSLKYLFLRGNKKLAKYPSDLNELLYKLKFEERTRIIKKLI